MKEILGKVVEAEKVAQANVIRRREETNAPRSLQNTVRVMDGNPTALRLKELVTLEKVTDKVGSISVFGGLDGVLEQLVRIKRQEAAPRQRGGFPQSDCPVRSRFKRNYFDYYPRSKIHVGVQSRPPRIFQ